MSLIPRNFYLDNIFDDFNKPQKFNEMKCDIYESNGNYNIEMDIPGYDKKDISIECEDGLLTVTAEKNVEENEQNEDRRYIRRERFYGKISRSFNFADIDEDGIKAELNNGSLKITIPKADSRDTKKVIKIN